MHQIVLLTALTATSGLFGGGGRCAGGRCNTSYAPSYYSYCQPGTPCGGSAYYGYSQPSYAAPQAPAVAPQAPVQYAPAQAAAPAAAPVRTVAAPAPSYYPSYYYPATQGCAGGSCYRR